MERFANDPKLANLAENRVHVALATGPVSQSFSHLHCLTLRFEWHHDRSLATPRCGGRQQRLGSLHVWRYIVDPLSVFLNYLSRWAPPGSIKGPFCDPSFRKGPQHHHSAQLLLSQGPGDAASSSWRCLALPPPHRFTLLSLRVESRSLTPCGIVMTCSGWHLNRLPSSTSDDCMAQIRTIVAPWSSILARERTSQWNSNLSYKKKKKKAIAFLPSTPK